MRLFNELEQKTIKEYEQRIEELEAEVHEWEESDKAAAVLRPILTDEQRADERRKTIEEIAQWYEDGHMEGIAGAIRAKFLVEPRT